MPQELEGTGLKTASLKAGLTNGYNTVAIIQ